MKDKITMLVGVPGSGKTWVVDQLNEKFEVIKHDDHMSPSHAYVNAILARAPRASKPLLIEAPFSMSQTIEPLEAAGYSVQPVFIIEDLSVLKDRYENDPKRDGKPLPKGHVTRMGTYEQRAIEGGHFLGTSAAVLAHLKTK